MKFNFSNLSYFIIAITIIVIVTIIPHYLRARTEKKVAKKYRLFLAFIRISAIAVIVFIFLDPYSVSLENNTERVELVVLVDESQSMSFKDIDGLTRWEVVRKYIDKVKPELEGLYDLKLYRYGKNISLCESLLTSSESEQSNLSKALKAIISQENTTQLGAVVLLSDGQATDADELAEVTQDFRSLQIPIYTILCGLENEMPDVVLKKATLNQAVPFERNLTLRLMINSPGFKNRETVVYLRNKDRLIMEKSVVLNGSEQDFKFDINDAYLGFNTYEVSLSPIEGERLVTNNSQTLGANVVDEKIKVLYMEGSHQDHTSLPRELAKDPSMSVTTMFITQGAENLTAKAKLKAARENYKSLPSINSSLGYLIYNVTHPEKGAPKDFKGFQEYDVIILSDILKECYTDEQLKAMVKLVEEEGAGFVMVGGVTSFGAGSFDETAIDRLLPVEVYGNNDIIWGEFGVTLTKKGKIHPIMQVGDTPEETKKAWKTFPGFSGCNSVNRPKPGAYSLANNSYYKNSNGNLVVWAVQQIGKGRSMAFTPDTTRDWGTVFQSQWGNSADSVKYFRKFWNNAVRWLSVERITDKNQKWAIKAEGTSVVGESVPVYVKLKKSLVHSGIVLKVKSPQGVTTELKLDPIKEGLFRTSFIATEPGSWIFTARRETESGPDFIKYLLDVSPDERELSTTKARPNLLKTIAKNTGGKPLSLKGSEDWSKIIPSITNKTVTYNKTSSWDRWWIILFLLVALSLEWCLRRKWGFA